MVSSGIGKTMSGMEVATLSMDMGKKASDVDFGMMIAQSLSENDISVKTESNNVKMTSKESYESITKNDSKVVVKEKKGSEPNETETNELISEKVNKTASELKEKIKEVCDVSDEDIENVLESMGMNVVDLLNDNNLANFLVELTGAESRIDFLVDPQRQQIFTELQLFVNESVENIMQEFGIPAESIEALITEVSKSTENKNMPVEMHMHVEENNVEVVSNEEIVNNSEEVDVVESVNNQTKDSIEQQSNEKTVVSTEVVTEKSISTDSKTDTNSSKGFTGAEANTFADTIINNITEAVNETFEVNGLSEVIDTTSLIEQISKNARLMVSDNLTSIEFALNPENLGKINLNISVREGVVTASIVTQNEAVKQAIENQILVLKENFTQQGIKVEAVEVTVESHSFNSGTDFNENNGFNEQHNQESSKTQKILRMDSLDDLVLEELTDEEKIVIDMMAASGNQMNMKV